MKAFHYIFVAKQPHTPKLPLLLTGLPKCEHVKVIFLTFAKFKIQSHRAWSSDIKHDILLYVLAKGAI